MVKILLWFLGFYFIFDGFMVLIFERRYVRLHRFGPRTSIYYRAIDATLHWPRAFLRSGGLAEIAIGAAMLRKVPLDVRSLYRALADGYAAIDPGWREWFYPQAHDGFDHAVARYLPQGADILDLGCGAGANLARLQAMNLPYTSYKGVDLSAAMLEHARQRYGQLPGVQFEQLDIEQDELPGGSYDLILSTWVFEHLQDPAQVAWKAWRQLKPGGRMIFLFETRSRTLLSRLVEWIYQIFSARLVGNNEVEQMPGIRSDRRFQGPLGELALVVAEKPAGEAPLEAL